MKVQLSRYYFNRCVEFAEKQLQTSKHLYAYRGESNLDKMKNDIITGKLGEVAALKYLSDKGYRCTKPDFEIYHGRRKSFDSDLKTKCGWNVHVKSQSAESQKKYGCSWLLQKSDSLVKAPSDSDIILMVSMEGCTAEILGTVLAEDLLRHGLFMEPKVPRYGVTKVALYLDSIKETEINLEVL